MPASMLNLESKKGCTSEDDCALAIVTVKTSIKPSICGARLTRLLLLFMPSPNTGKCARCRVYVAICDDAFPEQTLVLGANSYSWHKFERYPSLGKSGGAPPDEQSGIAHRNIARLDDYRWEKRCRGLYQLPAVDSIPIRAQQLPRVAGINLPFSFSGESALPRL